MEQITAGGILVAFTIMGNFWLHLLQRVAWLHLLIWNFWLYLLSGIKRIALRYLLLIASHILSRVLNRLSHSRHLNFDLYSILLPNSWLFISWLTIVLNWSLHIKMFISEYLYLIIIKNPINLRLYMFVILLVPLEIIIKIKFNLNEDGEI